MPENDEAFENYVAAHIAAAEPAKEEKETPSEAAAEPAAETVEGSEPEKESQEQIEDKDLETPKGLKRRFSKLTKTIRDLEAKLAEKPAAAAAGVKTELAKPEPVAGAAAKPVSASFDTYEDYVEALTDWKVDQKDKARAASDVEKTAKDADAIRAKAWGVKITEAKGKYEDWGEVVEDSELPVSDAMRAVITESDIGPDLVYFLGKNPDEARRIHALSPLAAAKELGKLEDKLAANTAAAPEKKITSAPKPPSAVGSKAPAPSNPGDAGNFDDYVTRRNAQLYRQRR